MIYTFTLTEDPYFKCQQNYAKLKRKVSIHRTLNILYNLGTLFTVRNPFQICITMPPLDKTLILSSIILLSTITTATLLSIDFTLSSSVKVITQVLV